MPGNAVSYLFCVEIYRIPQREKARPTPISTLDSISGFVARGTAFITAPGTQLCVRGRLEARSARNEPRNRIQRGILGREFFFAVNFDIIQRRKDLNTNFWAFSIPGLWTS